MLQYLHLKIESYALFEFCIWIHLLEVNISKNISFVFVRKRKHLLCSMLESTINLVINLVPIKMRTYSYHTNG